MPTPIAYLANGKLFVWSPGQPAREVISAFGQEVVNRALQSHELNRWRSEERGTPFSGRVLWGGTAEDPAAIPLEVVAITRGVRPGELLYLLDTGNVRALLSYDLQSGKERRLFHRADYRAGDLALSPDGRRVAGAIWEPTGIANLLTMTPEGRESHELTEGDSVDAAPAWAPGQEETLVYQSMGLGRDRQGEVVNYGPSCIERLTLRNGSIETLCSDPTYDYLAPRLDEAGWLYTIRRPWQGHARVSFWRFLLDLLLFPFRLVRAVVAFLNFFSLMFSGKPLLTAGKPAQPSSDLRKLVLWGRVVDAEQALRQGDRQAAPGLVPKDWELRRRTSDGSERVLAQGVVAYDLTAEGVIYSTGSAVYLLGADGRSTELFRGQLITSVVALPPGSTAPAT